MITKMYRLSHYKVISIPGKFRSHPESDMKQISTVMPCYSPSGWTRLWFRILNEFVPCMRCTVLSLECPWPAQKIWYHCSYSLGCWKSSQPISPMVLIIIHVQRTGWISWDWGHPTFTLQTTLRKSGSNNSIIHSLTSCGSTKICLIYFPSAFLSSLVLSIFTYSKHLGTTASIIRTFCVTMCKAKLPTLLPMNLASYRLLTRPVPDLDLRECNLGHPDLHFFYWATAFWHALTRTLDSWLHSS